MGRAETFHGYGPEQGYEFLREAIRDYYAENGVVLALDEIFVSDGAKSDLGNVLDLFDQNNTVCIPDPVYPVYVDTNLMDGRKIVFADATEANGFLPLPGWLAHGGSDLPLLAQQSNRRGVQSGAAQALGGLRQ